MIFSMKCIQYFDTQKIGCRGFSFLCQDSLRSRYTGIMTHNECVIVHTAHVLYLL